MPLILLWPLWAGAAEYWVDFSGTGTGSADGSDVDNLCADTTDADCAESSSDTVYLCNARTTQFPATSMVNGATYDWSCPGGTPASLSVSGSTTAMTLGARANVTIKEPTIQQTGTGACIEATAAQGLTIDGGGEVTGGGTWSASWSNDDDLGVIGPCGNQGFRIGNSNADTITIKGLWFKSTAADSIRFAPGAGISQDTITLEDLYLTDCGDADTEQCIWAFPVASSGATFVDFVVRDVLMERSHNSGINIDGEDAYTPTFTSPVVQRVTCYDCGVGDTGSVLRIADATGASVESVAGLRTALNGGLVATFYVHNSRFEDLRCKDTTLGTGQYDGFCFDADIGTEDVTASRILDIDNTGREDASGCGSGAGSCSGNSVAIYASRNVVVSSLVSINARQCGYMNKLASPPVTVAGNKFINWSCINPIDEGIWISSTVDADDMLEVYNVTISEAGAQAIDNNGTEQAGVDFNNFWNNASANNGQSAGSNDLGVNPQFVGGPSITSAADAKLSATSPLRASGTYAGSLQDFDNRRFKFPPSIGAFEAGAGDAATARTAAQPRAAR